jgi:hypothetical protein
MKDVQLCSLHRNFPTIWTMYSPYIEITLGSLLYSLSERIYRCDHWVHHSQTLNFLQSQPAECNVYVQKVHFSFRFRWIEWASRRSKHWPFEKECCNIQSWPYVCYTADCEPRFQFLGLSCVIVGYYASHGDEYPPGKILNFMSPSLKRFELPHCLLPIYLSSIFSWIMKQCSTTTS